MKAQIRAMFRILCLMVLLCAAPARAAEVKPFLDIKEVTSPGGLHIWLIEDHAQPIIALNFGFLGAGAVNDPADKQGLARILSNTLDEGAGTYDSKTFQKMLEDNAISLSFNAGRDHFYGSLKTLSVTKDTAFTLLTAALTAPRFDADPIKRMVDANITRIRSSMIDGDWIAARLSNDRAFAGHPYAQNSGGTLSSLPTITKADLTRFMADHIARDNLRIALVGDVTPEQAGALMDQVFGKLPPHAAAKPVTDVALQNTGKTFLYKKDMPQTQISMLAAGPRRTDDDYPAAVVMNHILGGGGFGSRLTDVIREKNGLTYGIYSGLSQYDHVALFNIDTSTKNETVDRMIALTRAEIVKMRDQGITDDDLVRAKGYLLGSMPTALTSTDRIADILLSLQMDHRPINDLDTYRAKINALTVDDVNKAAKKWLNPDGFMTVLVGQPQNVKDVTILSTLPNVK